MPSRLVLLLLATGALLSSTTAKPQSAHEQTLPVKAGMFEFHSGFWINLHHFLYAEASGISLPFGAVELPSDDKQIWNMAIEYYRQHFVGRDLLIDRQLSSLESSLAKQENATVLGESVGGELAHILDAAAPVYRQYWWPQHNAANQFWIHVAELLINVLGPQMRNQLASAYGAQWPAQPVRVDVAVYANWAGAYTCTEHDGQIYTIMASENSGNQGFAALETLFHEASHGIVYEGTGLLGEALKSEAKAHGIPVPKDFWHALIFYTAGEFTRRDLSDVGVYDYEPYADKHGLWHRGWQDYRNVLSLYWRAHMDGKLSLNEAVAQMMGALAITGRLPSSVQ